MVEGYAHITIKGVTETFRLSPLEIAGVVANRSAMTEIDAQPTGIGNQWRIKASDREGRAYINVTGSSLHEAVTKLVERLK